MSAISPEEAKLRHGGSIPEKLLEAVNKFLAEHAHKRHINLLQKELVEELKKVGISEREALDKGWLDFEDLYRSKGWKVTYDKPGFNESYDARWVFESK